MPEVRRRKKRSTDEKAEKKKGDTKKKSSKDISKEVVGKVLREQGKEKQHPEIPRPSLSTVLKNAKWWNLVLLCVIWAEVFCCPFNKVEESFNMQGVHDILVHHIHIDNYDHLEFPGVVPRTFIGAIVISILSSPVALILRFLSAPPLFLQTTVRLCLGLISWIVYTFFGQCVAHTASRSRLFSNISSYFVERNLGKWFTLFAAVQFHVPFYASRTLPNSFALIVMLLSYGYLCIGSPRVSVVLLAFAAIVFRCDMLVFSAPIIVILALHANGFRSLFKFVMAGLYGSVFSLLATVVVDSLFWKRFVWPEGEVLYFNTLLNKSSEWGVSPWHWYFTSALPRAVSAELALLPIGFVALIVLGYKNVFRSKEEKKKITKRSEYPSRLLRRFNPLLALITSNVIALALYSILPHKELRFIFPVLPVLTVVVALACVWILWLTRWTSIADLMFQNIVLPEDEDENIAKSTSKLILRISRLQQVVVQICFVLLLVVCVLFTGVFLYISHWNYPGALTFAHMHETYPPSKSANTNVFVHAEACMSGVTRFGEHGHLENWNYEKETTSLPLTSFAYVISPRDDEEWGSPALLGKIHTDDDASSVRFQRLDCTREYGGLLTRWIDVATLLNPVFTVDVGGQQRKRGNDVAPSSSSSASSSASSSSNFFDKLANDNSFTMLIALTQVPIPEVKWVERLCIYQRVPLNDIH